MPRVAGVEIPNEKRLVISLQYIFGIGAHHAKEICKKTSISEDLRAGKLSEDELSRVAGIIDQDYMIEGTLRRQVQQNVARLRDIGCYRGLRHRRGLPVRGQRTRTNARTRKGPRKTVAGKKGIKEMHRG
jgi:small subunit ribosomal protein S13